MKQLIYKILEKEKFKYVNKVFLCIGTTECIGDSIGPRVGEILNQNIGNKNNIIIGNLNENLNYSNINKKINTIYKKIDNPYIIVIDSALSNKEYIGNVIINRDEMVIGNSLKYGKIIKGNLFINGIVGEHKNNKSENYKTLNTINKVVIEKIVNEISNQIINAIKV